MAFKKLKKSTWILFFSLLLSVSQISVLEVFGMPEAESGSQIDGEVSVEDQASGWTEKDGGKYYVSPETGEMLQGFQKIERKTYYFLPETGEMLRGFQKIEDETYYFLPETGEMQVGFNIIGKNEFYFLPPDGQMQKGLCEIEGDMYYFSEDSGAMMSGWQKIKGKKYFFMKDSGVMLYGKQKIKGKYYYFSEKNGVMQTGWQTIDGKTYYADSNGRLISGWKKIGGWKYYFFPKNRHMATGSHKIGNVYYIFDSIGRLSKADGVHVVKVGKNRYLAGANGKAASGWQMIGNQYYYASKTGKAKRNTTYQGVTFTDTGAAANSASVQAVMTARQVLNSITNSHMTMEQKLNACWSYVTSRNFRYAPKYPNLSADGWPRQTAYDMLTTRAGNCYSFACAFAALASEIGYQPYIVCGRVHGSRDGASDGYTRHAWVRINGLNYDPEGQYAGWLRGIYGRAVYPTSHTIQSIVQY